MGNFITARLSAVVRRSTEPNNIINNNKETIVMVHSSSTVTIWLWPLILTYLIMSIFFTEQIVADNAEFIIGPGEHIGYNVTSPSKGHRLELTVEALCFGAMDNTVPFNECNFYILDHRNYEKFLSGDSYSEIDGTEGAYRFKLSKDDLGAANGSVYVVVVENASKDDDTEVHIDVSTKQIRKSMSPEVLGATIILVTLVLFGGGCLVLAAGVVAVVMCTVRGSKKKKIGEEYRVLQ